MKTLWLSYSAIDDYKTCPMLYKIKRVDKMYSEKLSTPLFFGGALDDASELIFKSLMKNGKEYDRTLAIERFIEGITNVEYLGETIHVPTTDKVKFSNADLQVELLTLTDLQDVKEYADSFGLEITPAKFVKYVQSMKKSVSKDELLIYNRIGYHCMKQKGIMMLDVLHKWSIDNIKEVHGVQTKFEIFNEVGDKFILILDLDATMKDGVRRTLDLKTASNAVNQYPDGCIDTSMQLHGYSQETNPDVGYVILDKNIRKKEPRVRLREIYGRVTDEMLDETFDTIEEVTELIRSEEFPKNRDSCFKYGKCQYYDLCHNGDSKGLRHYKREYKKETVTNE